MALIYGKLVFNVAIMIVLERQSESLRLQSYGIYKLSASAYVDYYERSGTAMIASNS